jgi:transcriptional regulator with GAF, ATPase, and Fis domain
VGELPLALQAELLRVVPEGTYKRLGSNTWQHTKFRLVCATNRDLPPAVVRGEFRHDLYHRIAGWICKLPPLHERPEDILLLASHFMQQAKPEGEVLELDEPVRTYLLTRPYPGNVRDLRQLVTRLMVRHVGPGPLTVGDIPEQERPAVEPGPVEWRGAAFERSIRYALSLGVGLKEIGRAAEETAVRIAMSEENGNVQRAARQLGVTDRALQMRRAANRRQKHAHGDETG